MGNRVVVLVLGISFLFCSGIVAKTNLKNEEVTGARKYYSLNESWKTWLVQDSSSICQVNLPHNWDDYYGYRLLVHGNLHGTAVYERCFKLQEREKRKQYFLLFEGVGTYADIELNGHNVGRYPVGRTTLTLNVTDYLVFGARNEIRVTAEHPDMITDMPWVCGGCSSENGFSEGSQPLGIFRPVWLVVTDEVRVEPFGVHIWNNSTADTVYVDMEVKNYGKQSADFECVSRCYDAEGRQLFHSTEQLTLDNGNTKVVSHSFAMNRPVLWSPESPYLYRMETLVRQNGKVTDSVSTPFGIRSFSWPVMRKDGDGRFFFNGKPLFINGVCEYEHILGNSHAFSDEQIAARVKMIRNAGFNAVRDAHQPHNLRYLEYWDKEGILFWPQFSSHIWYDTPEFRENFKMLLRRWVKERRNSPSVVLWGLQNESVLPEDFARECMDIIHEMDPMSRGMRAITTCNGGVGTDWNVIQNWSGTYGGELFAYGRELSRPDQLLNGEYGAWRTLGFHTEPCEFDPDGPWSEEHMRQILETKVRLSEKVRDRVCGHFLWLLSTHDNPGRDQANEAYRLMDKVGPCNNKGLLTPWDEPTDAYYMYQANYTDAAEKPFVYIVSHTWPGRFAAPRKATIEVYSNCDSVRLYNDIGGAFLGMREKGEIGTHLVWDSVSVRYNVLYAVGYHRGKNVAEDVVVLDNLEEAPGFSRLNPSDTGLLKGADGYEYLYRINCGGDEYIDRYGQKWFRDDTVFSRSWAQRFAGMQPYQASQRVTYDPIYGTWDWPLIQSFRFGRHELSYRFPVPDGKYRVELYFIEPWHGTGGGIGTDCKGLRIFDVAVNGVTVLDDLDIWAEAGHDRLLKKVVECESSDGFIIVDFPEVKAGQAVISAVAVSTKDTTTLYSEYSASVSDWSWDAADKVVVEKLLFKRLQEEENSRPVKTYKAVDARSEGSFAIQNAGKRKVIGFHNSGKIEWDFNVGLAQNYAFRFRYMNASGNTVEARLTLTDRAGNVVKHRNLTFPDTSGRWLLTSTTTGGYINAGEYKLEITLPKDAEIFFESVGVQ